MGYAAGQVLAQAVEATKSLDHVGLANYIRSHPFSTVVGDISFGKDGEWAKSRVVFTQFQNVTGNTLDQFKDTTPQVVGWPKQYKPARIADGAAAGEDALRGAELPGACRRDDPRRHDARERPQIHRREVDDPALSLPEGAKHARRRP